MGGWGKEIKLKAGAAGDKESKPPLGAANARRTGNQPGKPPSGTTAAGIARAAMQERKRRLEPGTNVGSHQ